MTNQEFVIDMEPDADWLEEKIRRDGSTRVRIVADEDADTEGHGAGVLVRAIVSDDADTEGHAISLHFPSADEADAFRRRLLLTGALAGTLALGAAGGYALSSIESAGPDAGAISGATVAQPARAADSDIGIMDASGAAVAGAALTQPLAADSDVGIMDASGAASTQQDEGRAEPPEQVVGPR
jgi:hypothetical protein